MRGPIDYQSKNIIETFGIVALLALATGHMFMFEARSIGTWQANGRYTSVHTVGLRWTYFG